MNGPSYVEWLYHRRWFNGLGGCTEHGEEVLGKKNISDISKTRFD